MEHTELSGTLPSRIGNLKRLYDFDLESTLVSGTIPMQIGMMTRLDYLHFGKTRGISGTLPSQVSLCVCYALASQ